MNRTEYMRELDALLHGISKEEREEAMQYYNDYFDDAGSENEEKVIEELGSPVKLAETIRAGINGNTDEAESYGEYGERGYQDRRFDSSEYPAGRDDYYKAIRRHVEKASHRMTGIHFQKDSILIQPILIRDIHMREIRDMVRVRRQKCHGRNPVPARSF